MSALHKTMVYLGFSPDEREDVGYHEDELAPVTQLHDVRGVQQEGEGLRRIQTVHPRAYSDARIIGEAFRQGVPVVMNLTEMDEAEAKRLVDFAAGLSFGLHGVLERVTTAVFLLSPAHVAVEVESESPATAPSSLYDAR